jgi:hypothetical protein
VRLPWFRSFFRLSIPSRGPFLSWAIPKDNKAKEMNGFGVPLFAPAGMGLTGKLSVGVIRRGA